MDRFRTQTRSARTDNTSVALRDGTTRPGQSLGKSGMVDDGQRKPSFRNRPEASRLAPNSTRKISDIYKNPQLYAGLWQKELSQWSFPRTCLQLVPVSAATQFCAVFAGLFSFPSLALLDMSLETATLPFLFSGIFGVFCIVTFRTLLRRFYNRSGKYVIIVFAFLAYLSIGVILILIVNVKLLHTISGSVPTLSSTWESEIHTPTSTTFALIKLLRSQSNSTIHQKSPPSRHSEILPHSQAVLGHVPIIFKVLAFVGFAILATSVGSGQYFLQGVVLSRAHTERHQIVVTIATLASAGGGCLVCVISSICLSWSDTSSSWHRILISAVVLCSLSLVLLLLSAVCFIVAWRLDIRHARHHIKNYSVAPARPQRTSRSPKEIFDECAHLLGHHSPSMPRAPYHNRIPKYYDPSQQRFVPRRPSNESQGYYHTTGVSEVANEDKSAQERRPRRPLGKSTTPSLERQDTLSTASVESEVTVAFDDSIGFMVSSEILKKYNYAIPREKDSGNPRLRGKTSMFTIRSETWRMCFILLLFLCLSGSIVSFEYTATSFLSMLLDIKIPGDATSSMDKAVRQASFGLLLSYVMFAASLVVYCKFQDKIGWKKLTLSLCLVHSILTVLLAVLPDSTVLFLSTAVSHGLLKMMVGNLPHLLMLQNVRTQRGHHLDNQRMLLIESSSCFLWCMMSVSLTLSSLAAGPITHSSGRLETAIVYSAGSGLVACLGLITIL